MGWWTRTDQEEIASPALRAEVAAGAGVAATAFRDFATYLSEKFMDRAVERDGVGRELSVDCSSRVYNGIELDLEETYQWGWDELYRIEDEMRKTCAQILPGASMGDRRFLESDPNRAIDGVEEFRAWMQDLQDRTISELAGTHFDIPDPLRRIEALIAPPGGSLAMYYTAPARTSRGPRRRGTPPAARRGSRSGAKSRLPTTKACPATTSNARPPSTSLPSCLASSG